MLEARVTLQRPRLRPLHHTVKLPTAWSEVPEKDRRQFWKLAVEFDSYAPSRWEAVRLAARLPKAVFNALSAEDIAQMSFALDAWLAPRPDCENLPVPHFVHAGVQYFFPEPKGANIVCFEYPLADEYYNAALAGDAVAVRMLTATLVREANKNKADALRRDDPRVPLYSRAEIRARAERMDKVDADIHLAAMYYFAGLKLLVWNLYGEYLFEEPEPVGDEADDLNVPRSGPNFGWWGTFQAVAESGVFGNVEQVHQSSLHDVCTHLVRQEEARRKSRPSPATSTEE